MAGVTTPFVVFTFPRSGSTWLMDMLNSHPEITAYGELSLGEPGMTRPEDPPDFATYLTHIPERARRPHLIHRLVYSRMVYRDRPGVRAAGFKLIYGQARANPGLLHFFALRRVRAIHLIRANLLDAVISYEVARTTGVFHPRRGEVVARPLISLDPERTRERLGHMEWAVSRARVWLERYRLPRLEVAYEEIVARREETLGRILHFLAVEPATDVLDSSLVQVGSSLELVENADAVRDALMGTRFEWMLREKPP